METNRPPRTSLVGKSFNKWTVVSFAGVAKRGRDLQWLCVCACGNFSNVKTCYLTKGYSKQCVECSHKPKEYTTPIGDAIWNLIIKGAKRRNIPFRLSRESAYKLLVEQNFRCKLSGIPIRLPNSGSDYLKKNGTASLDRICNDKGYFKTNVQWVHKDINRMKNIHSQEYFVSLCVAVSENIK